MNIPTDIYEIIKKYKNVLISMIYCLVLGSLLIYGTLYFLSFLLMLIPVVMFAVFHYTGIWKTKERFIYGTIIIIILGVVFTAAYTDYYYSYYSTDPEWEFTEDIDIKGMEVDDSNKVVSTITPGVGKEGTTYNFTATFTGSLMNISDVNNISYADIRIFDMISYNVTTENISRIISTDKITYYHKTTLPEGMYSYEFVYTDSTNDSNTIICGGPINKEYGSFLSDALPSLVTSFFFITGIMYYLFIAVIHLMRNSMKKKKSQEKIDTWDKEKDDDEDDNEITIQLDNQQTDDDKEKKIEDEEN